MQEEKENAAQLSTIIFRGASFSTNGSICRVPQQILGGTWGILGKRGMKYYRSQKVKDTSRKWPREPIKQDSWGSQIEETLREPVYV